MPFRYAAALVCALLGLAPAAGAQPAPDAPLFTAAGSPIPYLIDLPDGWPVSQVAYPTANPGKAGYMLTVGDERAMVKLYAMDIVPDRERTVPEALWRRYVTGEILRSDSLIFEIMGGMDGMREQMPTMQVLAREIRTLRGQRAGYVTARFEEGGKAGWMEMHVTLSEGIMYMLTFVVAGEDPAAYQPLFDRVRESLVFAPAPAGRKAR